MERVTVLQGGKDLGPGGRRGLVLLNRSNSRGPEALAPAVERLRARGIEVVEGQTASREEACAQIQARAAEFDFVAVGGGDGTANGVAPAILATGKPLAILPLGTANDLARTLGVPLDLAGAADLVVADRRRRIDLGLANDRPFFNVASLGLSVRLARALHDEEKRRLGRFSYAFAALRVLLGASTFEAAIAADGDEIRVRTYQIAVGNGRYYGGGATVRPDARIDDGRLDLYSLGRGSLWKVVAFAPLFRDGRHVAWREVRTASGRELEIRTPKAMPVNLDGDVAATTPLALKVLPEAVEVFAPGPGRHLA